MNGSASRNDLARTVLAVLTLALLILTTFWILKAFLLSLVWATMIVVSTWPMLLWVQKRLRGSRGAAVAVMTAGMLMILIVPIVMGVSTLLNNVDTMKGWVTHLMENGLPPLPAWVVDLPVVGAKIGAKWAEVTAQAAVPGGFSSQLVTFAQKGLVWFAGNAGTMGMIVVHLFLTLALTVVLYSTGEQAAEGVTRFFRRLSGEEGPRMVALAGQAIRAVAMGIVVTAVIQSALGGLGIWVAGIPGAGLLTAVMFILAIAQLGVVPVLAVAVGWLFWKGITGWAIALLVWTLIVGSLDNVIRPILIKRGADLPLLLIFAGVLGGLVAFGIVGLFVGPVVLAVSYTLVNAWIDEGLAAADGAPAGE